MDKCSPTMQVYRQVFCQALQTAHAQGAAVAKTLPFTGLDLAAIVFAGIVLVGGGLVLRKFTRGA